MKLDFFVVNRNWRHCFRHQFSHAVQKQTKVCYVQLTFFLCPEKSSTNSTYAGWNYSQLYNMQAQYANSGKSAWQYIRLSSVWYTRILSYTESQISPF